MGKYKYLIKNMGLMTISNFASKLLSFLLVPLYTAVLTTDEYGTYDLYATTAFLLMPIFSVCIAEAVMRFTLDKKNDTKEVFSIGFSIYVKACCIMVILIVLNYTLDIIHIFNQYPVYFVLYFCLCLLSGLLSQFAQGLEKIFDVAISGILSSATIVSLNILLLVVFPHGLSGYFISNCAAFGVVSIYLIVRLKIWKYFGLRICKDLKSDMTNYSFPLVLSQIGWWINNVSDRYVVTWLCGAAANGIYSVAYKIPAILNVFQTIFSQAWTLSTVREIDEKNSDFYTVVYGCYNCGMVVICSLLIASNKIIATILFSNDFYVAWKYAPFLVISVVFGALSEVFNGIFTATKNSKITARTTLLGASVNTILNIVLVYFLGPLGAAVSTLISYIVVWRIRMSAAKKLVVINIKLVRDIASYVILILQSILLFIDMKINGDTVQLLLFIVLLSLYIQDIKFVFLRMKRKHTVNN